MRNLIVKISLALFIIAFFNPYAAAQPRESRNLMRLEDKLNLTDAQKDKIEKLRTDHQKAMVDLRAKLQKAQLEMREITAKDDFSRAEFLNAHSKISKIREEIQLSNANHRMDILEILNKDQRKILAENRMNFGTQKHFMKKGNRDCPCGYYDQRPFERRRNQW